MKIKVQTSIKSKSGLAFFPVFVEDFKKAPSNYPEEVKDFIKRAELENFEAKRGSSISTYGSDYKIVLIGCGEKKKLKAKSSRNIGAKVGKLALASKLKSVSIQLPQQLAKYCEEFMEGVLLVQHKIGKWKTEKPKDLLTEIEIITDSKSKALESAIQKAQIISEASAYVKDLVNGPPNEVRQKFMADKAKKLAKDNKYKVKVFGDKELKKMGWGGILAVNAGSKDQAQAIMLEYKGGEAKEAPIVFIGKGIIFDTGGYNIKRTGAIEMMFFDMAGAAVVLGLFHALKKLGIKRNVVGIVSAAENMIGQNAYRPSDIITMYSGNTVEITNTDAEGRLVLADAIHHATTLKPQSIITIATLTGAVQTALSNRYCGLLGNNNTLRRKIQKAGREVNEMGWPLPIHNDYRKRLDSQVADFKNCDISRLGAGTATAAAFLEKFTDGYDWCHLDIGGTAHTTDPQPFEHKGATAHGLRMLLKFLES